MSKDYDERDLWQASAYLTRCPRCGGKRGDPSCGKTAHETLDEYGVIPAEAIDVIHAVHELGLDPTLVECDSEELGIYLIPITRMQSAELCKQGSLHFEIDGVMFDIEIPTEMRE